MDILVALLVFLAITVVIITVVGHLFWVIAAWMLRGFTSKTPVQPSEVASENCPSCNREIRSDSTFCFCGWERPSKVVSELLKDLAATERQVTRFFRAGQLDQPAFEKFIADITAERDRLNSRTRSTAPESVHVVPEPRTAPASVTQPDGDHDVKPAPVVVGALIAADDEIVIEPVPSFLQIDRESSSRPEPEFQPAAPREARRSFSEMLNAFMEESNIRWGEIIGGLLIIGCSTALVVSLWSEISQIPVLKFLIFTTVTAALFGVGLYTEHRWKLPTTSRGILTTATLLVPLNFLAIAAVSSGDSPGALVVASELVAPAVFLCLVYFAGKVLTPSWPHLLVAGVLGSSVGQLLVRHFASPDLSPGLLVVLGAFPLACYVGAAVWMLKKALDDGDISENETIAIFITLGAITFAAVLPFALLLYKTGPVAMTMMYVAPLVSLGGFPLLATGMFLWQRVKNRELIATRTVGTTLAILGTTIVVSGMILAWPNPASIVPAALFNFAVFTSLAILLRLPLAHVPAAFSFGLAYLVLFHVSAGNVAWQNLRNTSLLRESFSVSSGLALAPLFLVFIAAAEWLRAKRSDAENRMYLGVACIIAAISLVLVSLDRVWPSDSQLTIWLVYLTYALGAFWIAGRNKLVQFSVVGSLLLLVSFWQLFGQVLNWAFPWQTAVFAVATCFVIAAIVCRVYRADARVLTTPLVWSALISSFLAVALLIQAGPWQATAMQAQRVFWLSAIWFALLWLNRSRKLFTVFQVAVTLGVILGIKATLQQYEWYSYIPHVFLHPWGLQIQGTALVLLSLIWVGLRLMFDKLQFVAPGGSGPVGDHTVFGQKSAKNDKLKFVEHFRPLLEMRWSVDRFVLWVVLAGFVLLAAYGALSGVTRELTAQDVSNPSWDIAGFSHEQILQPGSWILLALIVIAMLANLWQRRRSVYVLGSLAALSAMVPLTSGMWEPVTATASAWRWFAAVFLILGSLPVWFYAEFAKPLRTFGWPGVEIPREELFRRVRVLLLALSITPILLLTIYPALRAIYYMPVHGPLSGFFNFLEESFSYGVPLVAVAGVLVIYALRQRLPNYLFAAGLFLNLTVTMAHLLSVVAVNGLMDRVVLAQVIQLNAIAFAAWAIVWLVLFERWSPRLTSEKSNEAKTLLLNQIALAITVNAVVILPVAFKLVTRPEYASAGTFAAGSVPAWLAFGLTILATALFVRVYEKRIEPSSLFVLLLAAACLVAFGFAGPEMSPWAASHALLIGAVVLGWLMLAARWIPQLLSTTVTVKPKWISWLRFPDDWGVKSLRYATFAAIFVAFLSLRRWKDDPHNDWWSIAPLLALTLLFATLNYLTLKRRLIYFAAFVFCSATLIWSTKYSPKDDLVFIDIQIIALSLSSVVWLALELRARRLASALRSNILSFHHLAALWSLLVVGGIVFFRLLLKLDVILAPPPNIQWLALASVTVLILSCLWDRSARYAVAAVYLVGLLFAGMVLDSLGLISSRLLWAVMIAIAIYTLMAAFAWRSRRRIMTFTDRWKLPRRIDDSVAGLRWLTAVQIFLAAGAFLIAYWAVLVFPDWSSRVIAALVVGTQAFTLALMAEGKQRFAWQRAVVVTAVISICLFGWSFLVPGVTGTWLNRAVILMVQMFLLTGLYGLLLSKTLEREPEWTKAVQACVPWIAGAGVVALLFSLATEVFYQINFGAVRIRPLALVAIGLTLIGGIVLSILFALSSKHDPLKLSERGRMNYVYAAEVMLALLFMHVRLTMPWLFTGFFERYWPFVVMAIAYAGVATAESLRRRKLLVLAQPIERTGAFLPLLPVIGFWLAQTEVDYSALLFIVGGLYGLLSILRRSFLFGLLAAVAGNGGLWYLWHRSADYHFFQHPQLWLIPVALSVLVAAYLNEDDFTEEQMAGIRYLSLVTIYASSTADIFINGVAESPWLPLVLAGLSLAGIFCGIIFRIRGFLLLGSVFLLLAIITMIWYASANLGWTWLWYVAGIVTGATIIFMFAVFEKKRSEVLRVVEGFKDWDR